MMLMQTFGQFASVTPVAFLIAVDILRNAYTNEISVTDEQWKVLGEAIAQKMQAEQAQAMPPQGASQGGGGDAPKEGGMGLQGIAQVIEQAGALLNQMPQELKEQIGVMLARGMAVEEIVANLMRTLQGEA
jgi:hypothetical protein